LQGARNCKITHLRRGSLIAHLQKGQEDVQSDPLYHRDCRSIRDLDGHLRRHKAEYLHSALDVSSCASPKLDPTEKSQSRNG